MAKFTALLRAMSQVTAEVTIEASSIEEAEQKARDMVRGSGIPWDFGDIEDEQVESVFSSEAG